MNTTSFKSLLLAALLLCGASQVLAEDLDIFSGGAANGANPNILILVDSAGRNDSANPTTCAANPALSGPKLFNMTQCALYTAIQQIGQQSALLSKLNIGLMSEGPQNDKGGFWWSPNAAPASLPTMDGPGISNMLSLIAAGVTKSNNAGAASVFQEAWAFYTGHTGLSGTNYSNHLTLSCQKSFIIFIGAAAKNGIPSSGDSGLSDLQAAIPTPTPDQQVQINTSCFDASDLPRCPENLGTHTGDDSSWMDEWARYLSEPPNDIRTYTIAATGPRPDADYEQILRSTAHRGHGKAFEAADVNDMVQAFLQIFNEVAAINSVFASASLPVSTNAQGTFQNQVFIGMFRPQAEGNPRWLGNLKQYQFGVTGTAPNVQLFLADATGAGAISASGTGFFSPTAVSFWTSKNTSTLPDSLCSPAGSTNCGFWINNPQGAGEGFDLPDGEIVEKGGVSQQIRLANLQDDYVSNPASPRNVYTCWGTSGLCASGNPGASLSATPFATTNTALTAAVLGLAGTTSNASSISRSGTTVTITLSAAPSPALTNGQQVTVQGAANTELNGSFTIALVNATTFTYTIAESPPSPSTGSYTATLPSSQKSVSSLTRSGTNATATSNGHGYANGQSITITGANGSRYNGTFVISNVTANTFQYTIIDSPGTATTGGSADIGATHTNPITFTSGQITRDTTHADDTSIVTVTSSSNLPLAYAAGAKVNVSGVTPSGYNVTLATITNTGSFCSGGTNKKSFCYSITTTPGTPDPSASIQADATATAVAIASLTHPVACTGGSPTPTTTVTATTSVANPFVTGNVVNIAGSPVGSDESAYVGSFAITVNNSTTFTYTATTSPPCSPSASGVTVVMTPGPDRDSLINWVRGDDNIGDEPSPGSGITIRPSVHGDVVHSRPTVINYGGSTGVVVFSGGNGGVFSAINGNQTVSIGGVPPGGELWSFVPQEFFSKLQRLYTNSPLLQLANTPSGITPTPQRKDYYFDGVTGAYLSGSTAYIYLSARRGGRLLYALDVSNPADPKFMWKRASTDPGFSELGQTWSTPKVAQVKGYLNPVLIFGAGYGPNEDDEPPTADVMGRGIFILDAVTGSIVWRATGGGGSNTCTGTPCQLQDMKYAVAADIAMLERVQPGTQPTGKINRLYAADTGGNIWRVDLEPGGNTAPGSWKATKFAALGGTGTTPRKFLFPPDVVTTANFDAVLAGTGDREHPLFENGTGPSYSVVNRFYMIKDTNTGDDGSSWTAVADSTSSIADDVPPSLFHLVLSTCNPNATPPVTSGCYDGSLSGFYITLPNTGEKIVNAPTTIGGNTYFGSYQPLAAAVQSCSSGSGVARVYQVNFVTGATASNALDTGGDPVLPPSPVAGLVNVTDSSGNSITVPFLLGGNPSPDCTGPDCRSSLGAVRPPIPIDATRRRVYWYLDKLDH